MEFQDRLEEGIFVFVAKKEILESDYLSLKKNLNFAFKRVGALKKI